MKPGELYGIVAEFTDPESLLHAARRAYTSGYRRMDAFTPYPVDDLAEAIGMRRTWVPLITLLCGIAGGLGGYGMQAYSAIVDYPLNVGGRPLHSWPAFVPVTFELTVLCAALGAVVGMMALNGLPRPNHPIFETPFFAERNQSRFYLCIEATDRRFERRATTEFLHTLAPAEIWEVPA